MFRMSAFSVDTHTLTVDVANLPPIIDVIHRVYLFKHFTVHIEHGRKTAIGAVSGSRVLYPNFLLDS